MNLYENNRGKTANINGAAKSKEKTNKIGLHTFDASRNKLGKKGNNQTINRVPTK